MPVFKTISAFLFVGFATQTTAFASEFDGNRVSRAQSSQNNFDSVTCFSDSSLAVRDRDLKKTIFSVGSLESVKIFQSFGNETQEKIVDGKTVKFIKVQFPDLTTKPNTGWVPEDSIRLRDECETEQTSVQAADTSLVMETLKTAATVTFTFPTTIRPSLSYKTGMRKFGSNRDGGARLHAASDLYRKDGEAAVSVSSGTVIRDRYYFYLGTYAIEVKNSDGKVVRYGEIKGKSAPGVKLGTALKTGQILGYIGTVNSGCCSPMLHFEMFAGTATGALTQTGNKYSRRKDLMDPSANLTSWEKSRFGQSY